MDGTKPNTEAMDIRVKLYMVEERTNRGEAYLRGYVDLLVERMPA